MSEDIIIQENGTDKLLEDISKVVTQKFGGSTVEWFLENECDLAEVYVDKNGTYDASDFDAYGISKIQVKVPKKGKKKTGKRPSSSGDPNDYSVTTDDEGNLVYTKLPTLINITKDPSKTSYEDGELIKKQGMVVKAYYADGGLWGDVPLGEIQLDPTNANASGSEWMHGGNILSEVLYYYDEESRWRTHFTQANENTFIYTTPNDSEQNWAYSIYLVSTQSSGTVRDKYRESEEWSAWGSYVLGNKYEKDGKAIWHSRIGGTNSFYQPISTPLPRAKLTQDEAWNIFYGDSGTQQITVKWKRPEDEKVLTDTFSITVHGGE